MTISRYERAVRYLKCISCNGGELRYEEAASAYICKTCDETYPIRNGVPRFVPDHSYVENFSRQWDMDAPLDPWSVPEFIQQTGILPAEWRGKVIVDAGCGKGKSETYISRFIDDESFVIAFDLSFGVERAARAFAKHENIIFIQARFEAAPIRDEVADIMIAKGTLMHSPDLMASFAAVSRQVKVGGKMAVELYPSEGQFLWERRWRRITRHLSTDANVRLAWLFSHIVYSIRNVPLLRRLTKFFPTAFDGNFDQRWTNTFDTLSPKYAWRIPTRVVDYMFRKSGFHILQFLQTSVDAVGVRIHPADAVPEIPLYFRPVIRVDDVNQYIYADLDTKTMAPGEEDLNFTPGFRHLPKTLDH